MGNLFLDPPCIIPVFLFFLITFYVLFLLIAKLNLVADQKTFAFNTLKGGTILRIPLIFIPKFHIDKELIK